MDVLFLLNNMYFPVGIYLLISIFCCIYKMDCGAIDFFSKIKEILIPFTVFFFIFIFVYLYYHSDSFRQRISDDEY